MTKRYKPNIYFILLFSLILFQLINNYIWLRIDNVPLIFDSHEYFMSSLYLFDGLKNSPFNFLSNISNATYEARHTSLFVQIMTVPFYAIFGTTEDVAVMGYVSVFLTILIFSIYGIGKKIANKPVALLSAFIITVYPVIFNQMRVYMLDLPLTSMVTLSIYLLLCTDKFRNIKYSILFGFSSGFAMLVKANFVLFIIWPLLIILGSLFWEYFHRLKENNLYKQKIDKKQLSNRLRNFIYSLLISGIIFLPYYTNFPYMVMGNAMPKLNYLPLDPPIAKFNFWYRGVVSSIWYLKGFIENQLSFFFIVVFIIGLCFFLFRFKDKQTKYILLSWIIFPYFLISYYFCPGFGTDIEWMYIRYTMPMLPSVAIITGIGIIGILNRRIKLILIACIIVFGLCHFFAISYGIGLLPKNLAVPLPMFKDSALFPKELVLFKQPIPLPCSHFSYPLTGEDKWLKETFEAINNSREEDKKIKITIIRDIAPLWAYLRYRAYRDKLPFEISPDLPYWCSLPYERLILRSDYIIIRKGDWAQRCWLERPRYSDKAKEIVSFLEQHIDKFTLVKKIKISDDAEIFIYKKNSVRHR